MKAAYLGIDVGSISTNLVLVDDSGGVLHKKYLRTHGQPMKAMQNGLMGLAQKMNGELSISGVGTTGSGRYLAGILVGADVIKNEITAHAVAALHYEPKTHTIIEIGGQDSKSIILRNGIVIDFAMNTVCAAGTGSFLDQQAYRLGIPIESFGEYALKASKPVKIASRCTQSLYGVRRVGHDSQTTDGPQCGRHHRRFVRGFGSQLSEQPGQKPGPPPTYSFPGWCSCQCGHTDCLRASFGQRIDRPT
jgi:predicted CoA-substrate-specific enzyme activase